jgi:tryptophan 2,3-dioxygenase
MLNGEQVQAPRGAEQEPLTYGSYLRVPELLSLQTPLGPESADDEMLFIILQQIQELWFKQVLFDLHRIIDMLERRSVLDAVRLLGRSVRIMDAVTAEVDILAAMPPHEFHKFRHVLTPSSGFESHQFRELELASGLREERFLRLMEKHIGLEPLLARWPRSLRDAAYDVLLQVADDPTDAWTLVYSKPDAHPQMFALAEALSEYEVAFSNWRFHHIKLVERTIGDHVQGTAGSAGAGYLGRTLQYRYFPELWEARNRVTQMTQH